MFHYVATIVDEASLVDTISVVAAVTTTRITVATTAQTRSIRATAPVPPTKLARTPTTSNTLVVTRITTTRERDAVAVSVEPVTADPTRALQTDRINTRIGSNEYRSPSLSLSESETGLELSNPESEAVDLPVGGRLRHFWRQWQDLGASKRVVRWLRFGYPLPFRLNSRGMAVTPPLVNQPPPNLITWYQDPVKQAHLDCMLNELVTKRAIEEIPLSQSDPVYFSRVFLVPKKNGKLRLILDLSALNEWLDCPSFKMDHAQVVRDALSPDMWATSIDLSDAYLHIPIRPNHCRFLVFQVGNRRFRWLVLPFGLNTAPRVFTDVMKALKRWGRRFGILLFQYLDDWLQLHLNPQELARQTAHLINQCVRLGLIVNHTKSEVVPMQKIVFLGDLLDFESGVIYPTAARFEAINDRIFQITKHESAPFRLIQSLVGLLTATEKIVPYGRLHFRELQTLCNRCISLNTPKKAPVLVSAAVLHDLDWWSDKQRVFRGLQMSRRVPDLQIQTDASTTGWGASFLGQVLSGTWTPAERRLHINILEMKAVLLTCRQLVYHLRKRCCLFLIDNSTVVSYLQKQGGTRSPALMQVTREVLLLAEQEEFLIVAQHIKGNLNVVADLASRKGYVVNTEWAFSTRLFQVIQTLSPWGPAVIDLFANSLNHRLPLYVSPCPDSQAMAVNALICQWPIDRVLYAFPPTTILDRVLQKILKVRPRFLLLIAPMLLDAQWYPLLQQLPCQMSCKLDLQFGDLQQPHWSHWHNQPMLFNLHLWCISFKP